VARSLLRACRPRQWAKNVLVAAAPLAAGVITHPSILLEVALAFVSFCLVSSATYLINDVRDRDEDRLHPRKRLRPIAAGDISVRGALAGAAVTGLGGIALATATRPALGIVAVGYIALTTSYSFIWRHVVVVDVAVIAAGFVLRAIAGGVATDVSLSRRFLVAVTAGAVFLVAGKRYAELRVNDDQRPAGSRATLHGYSSRTMRILVDAAAVATVAAYGAFAFMRDPDAPWFYLAIAPLAGWLWRYTRHLETGAGEAPEELVLQDRVLLGCGLAWLVLFVAGTHVSG
jgi:decaprenyl-phosphate phosphoribosyltransferase